MLNRAKLLIIDCQVFQTPSLKRGIGRYSFCLIQSLLQDSNLVHFDKTILLFSDQFAIVNIDELLHKLKNPSLNVIIERVNFSQTHCSNESLKLQKNVLDAFISNKYPNSNITYLILSAFEAGRALSVFPTYAHKAMIIYDIIPLIFSKQYLNTVTSRNEYFYRLKIIFEADVLFSISKTTKADLVKHLHISNDKIICIYGGPVISNESIKPKVIDINKPYFLFPSGNDWRKNNSNTINGFINFNKQNMFTLVVTSNFSESEIKSLTNDNKNIIFTDHVKDSELSWLYKNSSGVVFTSLNEGLGLPILEALEYNKHILASDIPAFREFGSKCIIYCNPSDIDSISNGFIHLSSKINNNKNIKFLKQSKYTWNNSAEIVANHLRKLSCNSSKKNTIAFLGPRPGQSSMLDKYYQKLFPKLLKTNYVDFYFENYSNSNSQLFSYLNYVFESSSINNFIKNIKKYNQTIYFISNYEISCLTYLFALKYPDTVILHDLNLNKFQNFLKEQYPIWKIRMDIENQLESSLSSRNSSNFSLSLILYQKRIYCLNKRIYNELISSEFLPASTIKSNIEDALL